MKALFVSAALLLATTASAAPPHGSAEESKADCEAVVRALLGGVPGGEMLLVDGAEDVEDLFGRGRWFMYRLYESRDGGEYGIPSTTCLHSSERTDKSGAVVKLPDVRRVWIEFYGQPFLAPTHDLWWVVPVQSTPPPPVVVPPPPVCP